MIRITFNYPYHVFSILNLLIVALSITVLLLTTYSADAFAQFQQGGVDKEGTWYVGEGLEQGDYFHYTICHIDYKECRDFEFEFWIKGDIAVGTETQLLAEVLVRDGNKVIVGNMTLGKLIPEPTGSSPELNDYRRAFGSSVPWLSAFATANEPKAFSDISWGKIANIGGEQILPTAIEDVTVPAGTWETVQITWKTGGYVSKVWVVDDFPFPIQAATLTHVSEGIPPPEYEFVLRDYEQGVQESPFEGIVSTSGDLLPSWCDTDVERTVVVKKATVNHHYQIHASYGPEDPVEGCEMKWLIKFIKKEDDTEFLNQVQFDFVVLDDSQTPIRSIAQDEGRQFLYAPSGQYPLDVIVKEDPGTVNYAVYMYGQAPDWVVPEGPPDFLIIPITIFPGDDVTPGAADVPAIPSWVKLNAGLWADGTLDDGTFIQAIQFLIGEGIIQIPSTDQGDTAEAGAIPSWVKLNAGLWADGTLDDGTFIQALQFLIGEGIITVPS